MKYYDMPEEQHGTLTGYGKMCRCEPCKKAKRDSAFLVHTWSRDDIRDVLEDPDKTERFLNLVDEFFTTNGKKRFREACKELLASGEVIRKSDWT